MNATDIIAYRSNLDGTLICLPCVKKSDDYIDTHQVELRAFLAEGEITHIDKDANFEPYFESDRQGDEYCDVCLEGGAI